MVRTLIAMVDAADPYGPGCAGFDAWAGPVLSLVALTPFDRVVLLAAPAFAGNARATAEVLAQRPALAVEQVALPEGNAADVLEFLRAWWRKRRLACPVEAVVVCLNAGPPESRGVWWSLATTEADVFQLVAVNTPRFITDAPASFTVLAGPRAGPSPGMAREPAVAYRVETDPDAYERAWPGREAGAAGSPPPSLDQALRQLGLCGEHPSFRRAVEIAATVAPHRVTVLLGGETGTGKGALARLIHRLSGRPAERFVTLNCAALPETLAESMLFGHKKGAFTGAAMDQAGKFEVADRGTLFLDEVGELPLVLQAKLLKVLEDGVVEPLGARQGRAVDVRVIAATNRDLKAAVADKTFREDLYYRLSVAQVQMPALRERRGDIPQLALHIVARLNASLRAPRRLSPEAVQRLSQHDWPGNIRDLENVIGRSLLLAPGDVLEAADVLFDAPAAAGSDPLAALPAPHEGFSLDAFLNDARRQLILRALHLANGKQSTAARLLGVTPQAISKFLRDEKK